MIQNHSPCKIKNISRIPPPIAPEKPIQIHPTPVIAS